GEVPAEVARRPGCGIGRELRVVDIRRHDGIEDEVGGDAVDLALEVRLRGGGWAAGADLGRPGPAERCAGGGARGIACGPVGISLEVPDVSVLCREDAATLERRGVQERAPAARVARAAEVETRVDRGRHAARCPVDQALRGPARERRLGAVRSLAEGVRLGPRPAGSELLGGIRERAVALPVVLAPIPGAPGAKDGLAVLPRLLLLATDARVGGVGGGPGWLAYERAPGDRQGQSDRRCSGSSHLSSPPWG